MRATFTSVRRFASTAAILASLCVGTSQTFAAFAAADQADDLAYNGGWTSGTNGGYGFGAWSFTGPANANPSNGGFFIGDSTTNGPGASGGINTGGEAWGLYANSGQDVSATRPLIGTLTNTDTISFSIDNGFIDNGGTVGIGLRAGGVDRFEFYFVGGQSTYTIRDASGANSSGIGYTDAGLTLSFSPTGTNGYSLTVTPNGGSPSNFSGTLIGSPASQDIDTFRAFNAFAGGGGNFNFFVNSLVVVPEPASLGAVAMIGLIGLSRRRR